MINARNPQRSGWQTCLDAFCSFLVHEKKASRHTVSAYRSDLDQFGAFAAERLNAPVSIEEIDKLLIRAWLVADSQPKPKGVEFARLFSVSSANRAAARESNAAHQHPKGSSQDSAYSQS